jgi:hypothetical protein
LFVIRINPKGVILAPMLAPIGHNVLHVRQNMPECAKKTRWYSVWTLLSIESIFKN